MQIRLKTTAAGPDWVATPGQTVDLDATSAQDLLDGGYAELVDGQALTPPEVLADDQVLDGPEA